MSLSKRSQVFVLAGNALEYYDAMLFGFFAGVIGPIYFPHDNPSITFIAAMGSYGAGFLMRPLGGMFFGHMGDRFGRKRALSLSMLLISLPTLIIAILPSYAHIGMAAPVILVLCRLLQGFCLGGESSGAMTFIMEHTDEKKKDMASMLLVLSCYVGVLVGTCVGSFLTLDFMPSWAWRIAFILGAAVAFFGSYVRRKLHETPEFRMIQADNVLKTPLIEILKYEKVHLMKAMGISGCIGIPFFMIFIYLNTMITKTLMFSASFALMTSTGLMAFWVLILPLVGKLSYKIGRKNLMRFGAMSLILMPYPLFNFLLSDVTFYKIIAVQVLLSLGAMCYSCPSTAVLVELFPANKRYSGIALGFSLGHALFSGFVPIIVAMLVQQKGYIFSPAFFLIGGGIIGVLALSERSFWMSFKTKESFKN